MRKGTNKINLKQKIISRKKTEKMQDSITDHCLPFDILDTLIIDCSNTVVLLWFLSVTVLHDVMLCLCVYDL